MNRLKSFARAAYNVLGWAMTAWIFVYLAWFFFVVL